MLEKDTRQLLIDRRLHQAAWGVDDSSRVSQELLVRYSPEALLSSTNHGFCDYVLLDRTGTPIALVEAKKTARDALVGKQQASDYADAILRETGREPFIFMTNGPEIWFWDRSWAGPRPVQGFLSLDDLEARQFQNANRLSLRATEIDNSIVDRDYQIEAIRRVYERLEAKRRKFLLVLATGTGKTRIAMAFIDGLMRANWVKRVLFLVDRRALADQAMDDLKEHLPSITRARIEAGEIDTGARAFVTTYPSMMQAMDSVSVGFFDLVICDESHRSIYNRYKRLLDYFDAYQLGLTATPVDFIERNTFSLFECDTRLPTFSYPFEDAVNNTPPYLTDYKVYSAQTRFQLRGIKAHDLPPEIKQQVEAQGITLDEIDFEGTDLERRVTNAGTDEALVQEFMDICIKDSTGTLPGKSIIFAISHRHAMNLYKAFERLYPEYRGRLVEVIDSHMEGAERMLKRFKNENYPRVAISVDMLDTGVDIREVVNLVFAKPVYSRVKFWQMIGRGTRLLEPSNMKPWCKEKPHFLIIDHWDNFTYFEMTPEGHTPDASEALPVRRFRTQIDLMELLQGLGESDKAFQLGRELRATIELLPSGFAEISAAHADIEQAAQPTFWAWPGAPELTHLRAKIAPLCRFLMDVDEAAMVFALKTERLALGHLQNDEAEIERQKERIRADLRLLPTNLREVKVHERELMDAIAEPFWATLDYDRILKLRDTFAPLMRYRRANGRSLIELNLEDTVIDRRWIAFGPGGEGAYVESYREEVEARIRELAESDPTMQKIKRGEPITEQDLHNLAETLDQADLFITEQNLKATYGVDRAGLVDFVRHALNLAQLKTQADEIGEAFDRFIAEHQSYSADQILFIRVVRSVIVHEAELDRPARLTYNDLFEPPFTRFGRNAVERLFTQEQLDELLGFVERLVA
ncbi:MAG: DEAD/DEAH box helicase family protein [Armatimonadota bacterium]|nr:DEAD/DEAH box helicase family protein [bacterium]